jgi:adenosylcobinamide-phosphate synthase
MQNITAYFNTLHSEIMDPDRIPIAILAIVLAAILGVITGPLASNANPFFWFLIDKVLGGFGDKLDKVKRGVADLAMRGFAITVLGLGFGLLMGRIYAGLVLEQPTYGAMEIVLLSTLITSGSVWYALLQLYFALEKKQALKGAYLSISRTSRINLNAGDDYGITRAGMGLAARTFDKGLVSPVFWYLIGGLPTAVIYTTLAALAWRFGKDGFSKGFGTIPLVLERLLGFIPSLFAAMLITVATTVTPTAAIHKGLASWFRLRNKATYEQGGFPLSALAWSLNVSLGGASQDLSGSAIHGAWVGPEGATARIDHKHLRRAIYINFAATILLMATLCGAYLWSGL